MSNVEASNKLNMKVVLWYFQFGVQSMGSTAILSWTDPEPHLINAVGVSTGYSHTGYWEIPQNMGTVSLIHCCI